MLQIKNNLYQVISLKLDAHESMPISGKQTKKVNISEPTEEMLEMQKNGIIKIEVVK
jgi:hypothetical protein